MLERFCLQIRNLHSGTPGLFFAFLKKAFVSPADQVKNRGLINGLKMVISFLAIEIINVIFFFLHDD